ncbi:MAG: ankyrin repeat domain-containing protein [Polyangiaceae bacterium]
MRRGAVLLAALLLPVLAGCDKKENAVGDPKQTSAEAGLDPNAIGAKGVSALQWAMLKEDRARFEALLDAGADVGHADDTGDTIVLYAAKANDVSYLNALLARHVDLNGPNTLSGRTALMAALLGERKPQFQMLLGAGANINLADRSGDTALHIAAQINENHAVLELLKADADPLARNKQGVTFQRYMNMTPTKIMSEEARADRQAVTAWLLAHHVPIEPVPPPTR